MVESSEFTCRICGNKENNKRYIAREMMFGYCDEFLYFQCENCQCLQIVSIPENISKYYSNGYYSFSEHSGKNFKGLKGKIFRLKYNSSIFRNNIYHRVINFFFPTNVYALFSELNVDKDTRILDVGCGNGAKFLYPLAEIGFKNLQGCDPYIKQAISYPNNLKIEKGEIFKIERSWDLITYNHSFEHVDDPFKNLKKVKDLLTPEGVCILRIPTVSSYAWEHYKTNWFQLDAPRHYFLHSTKSIEILADQVGLKLFKVVYDSTHSQFTDSEKYVNNISLRESRPKGLLNFIKRKLKKMEYQRLTKQLNKQNRGDQAMFYLRKQHVILT